KRVLQESSTKLHPYLPKTVRSLGISINNYSEVVELIWIKALESKTTVENTPEELAPHVAPDIVVPFLDQAPILLGKDDPKHKDNDVILETDTILKESEHGDAMKQQKSTDSRTTSQYENLGFVNAAAKKVVDPKATQTSKKRGWKPNILNKPEEGYDHAWVSGERRSKSHILLKGCGKDTKKRSSCSLKCAISKGLYGEEKTPIMTCIKRHQKEKNEKSISARDAPRAITKKKVSQPTSVASEEFIVVEALKEKHEKNDKKNIPARYRDKKTEALGFVFSITKESNFAKTSKDQRERKNSPSQKKALEEALGSVTIKQSNFPKSSKEKHKRKNPPSQEEDFADKVVREHDNELVSCRVRTLGIIDNASNPIHEIAPGPSDLSDMRLAPYKENNKILNVENDVPLLAPSTKSKKNACNKTKLYSGKATDDPMTPKMTMQHNSTHFGVHQNKGIEVEGSESGVDKNPRSLTITIKVSPEDGDVSNELVDMCGYKVKMSSAPILATIFTKYGDIIVNCQFKSLVVRASLLDVISDVIRRLKTGDVSISSIKAMRYVVSVDAKLDVAWLQQYLDEISEEEDMEKKSSSLMVLRETTKIVSKAAKKDLVERNKDILATEKRLKKAKRRL
ncbi:hypothetical protein H5410_028185, partial [Solanum commersonii]